MGRGLEEMNLMDLELSEPASEDSRHLISNIKLHWRAVPGILQELRETLRGGGDG